MFSFLRSALVAALLLISQQRIFGDDTKAPVLRPELAAADQLYRAGKFAEAEASYRALLKTDPKLLPAQSGQVRAMLRQQKIEEALDAVNAALTAQPNSAALLAAKGDVQFRRGRISEAEESYLAAKKLDLREVHTYLGLARLYASTALYRQAYDALQIAQEIAPDDIEVRRRWMGMLPRKEKLAALEVYLASPHPDDEEETMQMQETLAFLRATADKPAHSCKLVSKVEQTETNLETIHGPDARQMRGIGLYVKLNNQSVRLLLDTGAGGIMVSRKIAESAGLIRISTRHYAGVGDQGLQSGYTAVADHIRIGELEFQDCVVAVIDKDSVVDQDGLIGANVFGTYLIDLDLPGMRLKLGPLPKRPEDTVAPKSLNTEGEEQGGTEHTEGAVTDQVSKEPKASAPTPTPSERRYKDRYIAPEMAYWTEIFRIGHLLLVPTIVGSSEPMLFGLDTGAVGNLLSNRAVQQNGMSQSVERAHLNGLSGRVDNAGFTDATLSLTALPQWKARFATLDLSQISRRAGTEVSGLLGLAFLRWFEVKLDYRDGLLYFVGYPTKPPEWRQQRE
jgi:tetratricopeptide (TPR) repeat protein